MIDAESERPRQRVAQRAQLAPQPRRLERARHAQRDVVEVERLGRVVERAGLHRLDDRLHAPVRGQHDHERVGIELAQLLAAPTSPSSSGSL